MVFGRRAIKAAVNHFVFRLQYGHHSPLDDSVGSDVISGIVQHTQQIE